MNKENIFDYLVVPKDILSGHEALADDFWNSTVEMNYENRHQGKDYRCSVVCVGCTYQERKYLSERTGIPLSRITNVDKIEGSADGGVGFASLINAAATYNGDFFGRIKIYASQEEVLPELFSPLIEVIYAD